ncbi:hypothetical protein VYU27_010009 [Nannochloropsis oceanica]
MERGSLSRSLSSEAPLMVSERLQTRLKVAFEGDFYHLPPTIIRPSFLLPQQIWKFLVKNPGDSSVLSVDPIVERALTFLRLPGVQLPRVLADEKTSPREGREEDASTAGTEWKEAEGYREGREGEGKIELLEDARQARPFTWCAREGGREGGGEGGREIGCLSGLPLLSSDVCSPFFHHSLPPPLLPSLP